MVAIANVPHQEVWNSDLGLVSELGVESALGSGLGLKLQTQTR